jgi:hydroxymethylpyrimidine/phosphomethylpyrimidine kinase
MERYRVVQELKKAIARLRDGRIGHLIPEVSSNLGYALPFAEGIEDVAAFPGRIIRLGDSIATQGDPEFVASRHIANIILTVMRFVPEFCSAMNIRYSRENVLQIKKRGFSIDHFDRRREPRSVKQMEGSSLEWGVGEVLRKSARIPDFIYDEGDVGKEPMIRVLGRNPLEVVGKVLKAVGRKQ